MSLDIAPVAGQQISVESIENSSKCRLGSPVVVEKPYRHDISVCDIF